MKTATSYHGLYAILTEVNCVVYYGELFFCDPSLLKFEV